MTDPVAALVLVASAFAALVLVWLFRTLDANVWRSWRTPLVAGVVAGTLLRLTGFAPPWAVALLLAAAALYVRLTGHESEPVDGMILGAASGAAAAIPFVLDGGNECRALAECLLAGAVAGYGTTFASFHVTEKLRRLLIDAATMCTAVGAAYVPALLRHDRLAATAAVVVVPAIAVITVFRQWPDIRAQLRHEASLGFINDSDVRRTAHPLLRLGSGGWTDRKAHREFVRLANRIAQRKRQQRMRPGEIALLYQVEIIKLRMQIHEMRRIDHDVVSAATTDRRTSDTMAHRQ